MWYVVYVGDGIYYVDFDLVEEGGCFLVDGYYVDFGVFVLLFVDFVEYFVE